MYAYDIPLEPSHDVVEREVVCTGRVVRMVCRELEALARGRRFPDFAKLQHNQIDSKKWPGGTCRNCQNPTSVKVAAACLAHLGNAKTWAQLFGDPEKLGVLPRYFRSCRGFGTLETLECYFMLVLTPCLTSGCW